MSFRRVDKRSATCCLPIGFGLFLSSVWHSCANCSSVVDMAALSVLGLIGISFIKPQINLVFNEFDYLECTIFQSETDALQFGGIALVEASKK